MDMNLYRFLSNERFQTTVREALQQQEVFTDRLLSTDLESASLAVQEKLLKEIFDKVKSRSHSYLQRMSDIDLVVFKEIVEQRNLVEGVFKEKGAEVYAAPMWFSEKKGFELTGSLPIHLQNKTDSYDTVRETVNQFMKECLSPFSTLEFYYYATNFYYAAAHTQVRLIERPNVY